MVLQEKPGDYISSVKGLLQNSYDPKPAIALKDPFKFGCPQCSADKTKIVKDYDNGEVCCRDCGSVIYSEMNSGPERRSYNLQEASQRARTGAPSNPLLHDKGLGTVIDPKNIDFYGRKLIQASIPDLNRLRKWNTRCRVNGVLERSISYSNNEIDLTCVSLDGRIPKSTQETAVNIMTRVTKGKTVDGKRKSLIQGRSRRALVKASTMVAARKSDLPVTFNDMVEADGSVSRKELARAYRDLVNSGVNTAAQRPETLMRYYVNNLWNGKPEVSSNVETIASSILKGASSNIREDGTRCAPLISGKGPAGMAAAIVYMSGLMVENKENWRDRVSAKTQKEVAEIAKVTEVTVRNRYKDIMDKLMIECSV